METSLAAGVLEETGWSRTMRRLGEVLHTTAAGALSGAVAGVIAGGLGGRLAMRITAIMATSAEQGTLTEAEETVGQISFDGTMFFITFIGVGLGVLGGLIYASSSRWFAGFGAWRGLAFGLFLLAALGWAVIEGDNFDFSTLGALSVNLIMYAGIYVLFGLLVAPLFDWARERLPRPGFEGGFLLALPLYVIALFLSALVVGAFLIARGGEDGGEAPLYSIFPAYLVFGLAIAGAVIARRGATFDRLSDLSGDRVALALALAVIALPLAAGVALDVQSLDEMLRRAY